MNPYVVRIVLRLRSVDVLSFRILDLMEYELRFGNLLYPL